ncbi:MAG: hypothetical protein V2I82_17380 [Halieaceae bacterium]|nr:hypothetical protein [Halieaceae bacterium]
MKGPDAPAEGLFSELRRRRVLRTLALYILGAWGLMQVADVLLPAIGLPDEALRYVLLAAIAGFPVALIFGWFFDITAGGIRRTPPRGAVDATEFVPLRAVDYALLLSLAGLLGFVIYGAIDVAEDLPLAERSLTLARPAADRDAPPMVGVLPFAHMGSSEDGEFFAAGIHDDLLTRLARLGGLRVISRTSVLQYAGTSKTIPEIGSELRADAILEGGVRVAGNRIRINAQLIDARSDEHLWAETFDRELSADNIFEVQADIARAISAALRATLTPEDAAELDLIPTSNMAAYREYHEIMQWRREVHLVADNIQYFIDGLQRAIDLDPNFTSPMVEIVAQLSLAIFGGRGEEELPRVEALIDRIGRIAPDSADYYAAQSFYVYYVLKDFDRALALVQRAQRRAPSDPHLVKIQSWIQRRQGDFEAYTESARIASKLDPNDSQLRAVYGYRLASLHRHDEAEEVLRSSDESSALVRYQLALLALRRHGDIDRYDQDLETLMAEASGYRDLSFILWLLWEAKLVKRDFAAASRHAAQLAEVSPDDMVFAIVDLLEMRLMLALFRADAAGAAEAAAELKGLLTADPAALDSYPSEVITFLEAMIALGEGKQEAVEEKLAARWRDPDSDRAWWLGQRQHDCQFLAMAQSKEAVPCLRSLLTEPSRAHAFYEPLLPFYDKVRETPEFRQLISEQLAGGRIPAPIAQQLREL